MNRKQAAWIDIKTLGYRWDCSPQTAARVARFNGFKIIKLGKARNASVKIAMADVMRYER